MGLTMQYCPYCSGAVVAAEEDYDVCGSCGKRLYRFRADIEQFPVAVGKEEKFAPVIEMIKDENYPKAFYIVSEMIEESGGEDPDELLLLGVIYMKEGEDGKALIEWKKAIEKLETFQNIDVYVCMMSEAIADHIYFIETEFVVFDYIKYIDRLGEILYTRLNEPCTYALYLTVNRIYRRKLLELGTSNESSEFRDVIKKLFCRIVEYNRNCLTLMPMIDDMLKLVGYDEETYVEDDNLVFHMFNLIHVFLAVYIEQMTPDEFDNVRHYWNDENTKILVEELDGILSKASSDSGFGLLKRKSESDFDMGEAVHTYVKKYLLKDSNQPDAA